LLLNLSEPGREPGKQVPDGAVPGRISESERIFVGKVLNIRWGTGNVSDMGAPGRAEVECVQAFRGVQVGQRVIVTVLVHLICQPRCDSILNSRRSPAQRNSVRGFQ
jgi:hypothetical protein